MAIEIRKDGGVVSRSRNLRGILDYGRKHGVAKALVLNAPEGALVRLAFEDGAFCYTEFADYSVAVGWINARRAWGLESTGSNKLVSAWAVPS